MATETDIVNIALRRIGAEKITSLRSDASKAAVAARDIYDEARKELLNLHNWNFAVKRTQLTASATAPVFGWSYAFPLPEDYIRLISVHPSTDEGSMCEYRMEHQTGEDRVIVTDSNLLYIKYVFDLEDVNLMSASFREAFGMRLARDLAGALSKSSAAAELAEKAFSKTLSRAKSIDGIEDFPDKLAEGSWATERGAYSGNGLFR